MNEQIEKLQRLYDLLEPSNVVGSTILLKSAPYPKGYGTVTIIEIRDALAIGIKELKDKQEVLRGIALSQLIRK